MKLNTFIICIIIGICTEVQAQITEREKSVEWEGLVEGGRFMDIFLPMPIQNELTEDTWGAAQVIPRDLENGIEDSEWSYWGGNVKVDDKGKYHLFVARWSEDSSKGHAEWPNSIVVRAVSDNPIGPYKVKETIGKGHNPEAIQLKDGRYLVYVIDNYYLSDNIDGPWTKGTFEFDPRGRRIIEGLSNLTFAQREDGSYLMVCRGGGVWISESGVSPYNQISQGSVYPSVDGEYEDPVIWKDHVQYHMIVNDWLGRIAYYLRSKDGVDWKVDPGEAYKPGIARYENGTVEDWFKFERIKIFQDDLGRAIQANFAVIDTLKGEDKPNDNHSSKNISIPLVVGKQIEVLNKKPIDENVKEIRLRLKAEIGFNPQKDVDVNSLRFGASEEVNFGRGSKVKKIKNSGSDLILTFHGEGNGLSEESFAGKLLGRTRDGKLLFGYSRLPGVAYLNPIISARKPVVIQKEGKHSIEVEVENFGQVKSAKSTMVLRFLSKNKEQIASFKKEISRLKPYEKMKVVLPVTQKDIMKFENNSLEVIIISKGEEKIAYKGEIEIE